MCVCIGLYDHVKMQVISFRWTEGYLKHGLVYRLLSLYNFSWFIATISSYN